MEEKLNSIDLFKFLMAIVVVAIHTNPFVSCKSRLVNEIAIVIETAAVPFFFMASGYLLAMRWGDTRQQREKYVQKMLVSTIQLYTIWTLLSLPLSLYGYAVSGNSVISCIFSYVKYFFFVGTLYNSYHLWYLLATIYSLLTILILIHKEKGIRHILAVGVSFYAVYLMFRFIRGSDNVNGLLAAAGKTFYFVFNDGGILAGLLYIGIGICIRVYSKMNLLIGVAGIAVGVLIRYKLSQEFGDILFSIMFFILVLNVRLADRPCYLMLRVLSKYIYLSHLLCFSLYTFIIIGQANKLGVDSFLITLMLAVAVSTVIMHLKGRLRRKGLL